MNRRSLSFLAFFVFASTFLIAQNNYEVLLHTGETVFPENARTYPPNATISEQEIIDGNYYRLLQFYQLPTQQIHDNLTNAGIELLEYIPNKTYLASIPSHFDLGQLEAFNVRSIVEVNADLKIAYDLTLDALPDWATHRNQVEVMIKYHKNLQNQNILNYCLSDRIKVLQNNNYNNFLLASIPQNRITEVANLPYIAFVELRPAPDVKDDTEGRSLHRANAIETQFVGGRKYSGEGISVLTRDDGNVGPHIDFQGRIHQEESLGFGGTHGDGVSGIFAGAGNLNPRNRGMAAGADLYVISYDATFLDNTMDLFFDNDVLVTNSSYSNGCNAGYTEITETVDQQVWENPTLLHVFSAGNSNNNDCNYGAGNQWGNITGGHKQGKNVIATANLNNDGTLVNSSSRGPAHDGRIKPDIAANGADHISTDPDNEYAPFGGTSGAAPGIAGITAMLHHAYAELNGGETASSALLKAILLNTANDLGNQGPDFRFGWGHVNAYRAALALEENNYTTGTASIGTTSNHTIEIPANVAEARIMVYWADQPGTVMATKALVNDLNSTLNAPDGTVHSPWILDPAPDPANLNLPATTGIDDLNNMEQISLQNPAEGTYTLDVEGFELPFGDHEYYVLWEFRMNDITVIYPLGGERLVPGETERIHWDAEGNDGSFIVEYSIDNGMNWQTITTLSGASRMSNWIIPNELTGNALIRISRDNTSDTSDATFSIAGMPSGVEITKVCPDFMRVEWQEIPDATSYDIHFLGEKYMEVIGSASTTMLDIPISNPFDEHWVAVSANFDNGAKSRRTNAIFAGGQLVDCLQENNLTNDEIISPDLESGFTCESPFSGDVSIAITNSGTESQDAAMISYQVDNQPIVTESLGGVIDPGQVIQFTFSQGFEITENGIVNISVWVDTPDETVPWDDTLSIEIPVFVEGGAEPDITEDFEGADFPKENWRIENPDNSVTWTKTEVIGITGEETDVTFINFFNYPDQTQFDYYFTEPIDLSNITQSVFLSFDIAYTTFNTNFQDGLRIELSTDCGQTFSEELYFKFADDLATVPSTTAFFSPDEASDWRTDGANLTPYIGMDKLIIRFIAENGFGNGLYIDNINIQELDISAPIAAFEMNPSDPCQGEEIIFTSTSTGEMATYEWNFGSGAFPLTATGEGPHSVVYPLQGGDKDISLTVTNIAGSDTFESTLLVNSIPTGSFDFEIGNDGEVNFTSNLSNVNSISWDFGNGEGSEEFNPTFVYDEEGSYTVVMTITNDCGEIEITQVVDVTSVFTNEVFGNLNLSLSPNPNNGIFVLKIDNVNTSNQLSFELTDIRGVIIQQEKLQPANGQIQYTFEQPNLPSGVYFLRMNDRKNSVVSKIIIDK